MRKEKYEITGMHCAACSASVEKVTRRLPGVERSDVNLTTGIMEIVYDEKQVSRDLIRGKVEKAGFGISRREEHPAEKAERERAKRAADAVQSQKSRLIGAAIFSASALRASGTDFNAADSVFRAQLSHWGVFRPVSRKSQYGFSGGHRQLLLLSVQSGHDGADSRIAASCTPSLL